MTDSRPEELLRVEQLIYKAKFEEALEIIEDFKKKETLTPEDQLSTLLLKGRIYASNEQYKDAVKVGRRAYRLAQKHEKVLESIEAMILKSHAVFLGEFDKALELILEAEKKINLLTDESFSNIQRLKAQILRLKPWAYFFKSDYDSALESAEKSLLIVKKIGNKLDLANYYKSLGYIYLNLGFIDPSLLKYDTALDYGMKSLDLMKELDFHRGIASSLSLVSGVYIEKGDLNQALNLCKKSLSIKEISNQTQLQSLQYIGLISYYKGEIHRSIKYYNQALKLARELNAYNQIAAILWVLGYVYRMMGETEKAIESLESSLALSEKIGYIYNIHMSLFQLIVLYLDKGSREQAQQFLTRLEQMQPTKLSNLYLLAKAVMLKTSGRTHNRAEAEVLLRKILDSDIIHPELKMGALFRLCDLYLEDLNLYNNLEVLDDINLLVTQMLNLAEERHSYFYLAFTKLLQSKLALIQLNSTEAKKLLVEAQRIAEFHGFDLVAIKISSEHDALLTQVDDWENLKKKEAPIEERLNFVSLEETIDIMLRKRGIQPPELIDEEPVLLLIIAESGIPAFSKPFVEEWSFEDGFISNFLTAFNTFSEEVFSKGLDRAAFGEYKLIMESIDSFSVCYLFKGQTYVAKQKLSQFSERVYNIASVWQVFRDFHKTHQAILLSENPSLESLITEIFIKKNPEISTPI